MFTLARRATHSREIFTFSIKDICFDREIIGKELLYGIISSLLAGSVMAYITVFHGNLLASLFSGEQEVIAAAFDYLKAYGIDYLLVSILFCFIGYYNG